MQFEITQLCVQHSNHRIRTWTKIWTPNTISCLYGWGIRYLNIIAVFKTQSKKVYVLVAVIWNTDYWLFSIMQMGIVFNTFSITVAKLENYLLKFVVRKTAHILPLWVKYRVSAGIILCMCPANERWRYIVTSYLISWAHTQNDPCVCCEYIGETWLQVGDFMLWCYFDGLVQGCGVSMPNVLNIPQCGTKPSSRAMCLPRWKEIQPNIAWLIYIFLFIDGILLAAG